MSQPSVAKLYQTVIDEVIDSVREAFVDEGVDEQVLIELKQLWQQKLNASKALETGAKAVPQNTVQQHVAVGHMGHGQSTAMPIFRSGALPTGVVSSQTAAVDLAGGKHWLLQSGAAATATMALPAVYQQQFLSGNFQFQQTSSGQYAVAIPASALQAGAISMVAQPPQIHPQNLSTKVHGQLDGCDDEPIISGIRKSRKAKRTVEVILQLDGAETSSDDDDDIDDDVDDDDVDADADAAEEGDEEPLNSDDDVSGDEQTNLFETDNVIVCQYDKITRSKNRWRFSLKDGIMNINGRDHVFQKATGEAEW